MSDSLKADEAAETANDKPKSGGPVTVHAQSISKTYPGTRALSDVSVSFRSGCIHGLIGGNGSGKSTLIKILSGIEAADSGGRVTFGDEVVPVSHLSPSVARANGVAVVHQDLGLFQEMTVLENLALVYGFRGRLGAHVQWRHERARAAAILERFGIDARPDTVMSELSPITQTLVAIARAMQDHDESHGLLILDEPTASLPAHEVGSLLASLRVLAAKGKSIVYVSHRLPELLAVTDEIIVLRDGRLTGQHATSDLNEHSLTEAIHGRSFEAHVRTREANNAGATALEVRDLSGHGLHDVSFEAAAGEVIGLAGLAGSGRTRLLRMLFGDLAPDGGEIHIAGKRVSFASPTQAVKAGVAYVPESRLRDAAFVDLSIGDNILIPRISSLWKRFRFSRPMVREAASTEMTRFLVKSSSASEPLGSLSGGNQQKTIMARWLSRKNSLVLLDEPSQGVDVGTRHQIHQIVRDAARDGAVVLVVSSDLEELSELADRAIVFKAGRLVAQISSEEMSPRALTAAAIGTEGITL